LQQRTPRRRAERNQDRRLDDGALALKPPAAALNLRRVRPLVQFAALFVLEVLDRIGEEDRVAWNSRLGGRAVEDSPCGPYERFAGQVFLVAGLLSDEHEPGPPRPLAGNDLRCRL